MMYVIEYDGEADEPVTEEQLRRMAKCYGIDEPDIRDVIEILTDCFEHQELTIKEVANAG